MEMVRLAGDGRLVTDEGRDITDPAGALGCAVSLEKGCTLRTCLLLLQRYPLLAALSEFIPASMEEMDACPVSGCTSVDISALVLGKTMELIGFPGEPRAEMYIWLRGIGAGLQAETGSEASGAFPAAVEESASHLSFEGLMQADVDLRFKPMQFLLDMPLYLGGMKHVILGDMNRELVCRSRFTLFEVVDGLAWELAFRGGTEQCYI